MLLYDILKMENTVDSSPPSTTTTTRRLRSLHLPSSSSSSSASSNNEISRRFNSLRRPTTTSHTINYNNSNSNAAATVAAAVVATEPTINDTTEEVDIQKVQIRLVPNVGMTNRCFVFDVVDRELEMSESGLKLGRYSDRTVVSDRLSFKSKVVSRYHAEIWLSEDGKVYLFNMFFFFFFSYELRYRFISRTLALLAVRL